MLNSMTGKMPEVRKIVADSLSLTEEISHAKLSIEVSYPEHPDVLSPSQVFCLTSYSSIQYIILTLYIRFVICV
jgi:hypothetical protein